MNKDRSMLLCRGHIGKMELKNRIIMAPMGTTADGDGGYSARTIRYFTERAKGGTGLIITGRNASVLEFEGYSCSALSNYHHVNRLAALADNVVVKIPTMVEGLAATRALADEGIPVNMTLCFTVPQAILAARAGARYISPFVGRFDDIAEDGISQLADVVAAVNNSDFGHDVEIIAASVRSANHVTQAALMGADIATVPFAALKKCVQHPLTDRGLDAFMKDWEKVQQA